jgi:hypothetical protein
MILTSQFEESISDQPDPVRNFTVVKSNANTILIDDDLLLTSDAGTLISLTIPINLVVGETLQFQVNSNYEGNLTVFSAVLTRKFP